MTNSELCCVLLFNALLICLICLIWLLGLRDKLRECERLLAAERQRRIDDEALGAALMANCRKAPPHV